MLIDGPLLQRAFTLLDHLLAQRRLTCRVYVFGGAAVLMALPDREATRDVDSRDTSTSAVEEVVAEVARRLGLPRGWLNEQATVYLPRAQDTAATVVHDSPHLTVERASVEHLLAMKANAARTQDAGDICRLAAALSLTSLEEVAALHGRYFVDEPLTAGKRRRIAEALAADNAP